VADDLVLEAIFVLEAMGLVLGPGLTLGFRNGSCVSRIVSMLQVILPGFNGTGPVLLQGSTTPIHPHPTKNPRLREWAHFSGMSPA
jgi:hypothetical protein